MPDIELSNNGNTIGPTSSVDNSVPRFNGVNGVVLQNSNVVISDSDDLYVPGKISSNLSNPSFVREGTNIPGQFASLRPNSANGVAGFFAMSSDNAPRSADFSLLRSRGSWDSPSAVLTNDSVGFFSFEAYDGTDYNRSAVIRSIIDGTVSANTVPMELLFQTSQTNEAGLATSMAIRANGVVRFGGTRANPTIVINSNTGAVVFNEQGVSGADIRMETDNQTYGFFLDTTNDAISFFTTSVANAWVTFGAGTTAKAPYKYIAGTNLTTPVNGTKEYDGTNEFITAGGTRYTLAKTLTATATLNYASIAAGGYEDLTITVTGAASGDVVAIGVPNGSVPAGMTFFGWVSATNTVTIRALNPTAGALDPASGTFRASVIKY